MEGLLLHPTGLTTYLSTGDQLSDLEESNPEAFRKYQEKLYSDRVLKNWENKKKIDRYLKRLERINKADPDSYRCI